MERARRPGLALVELGVHLLRDGPAVTAVAGLVVVAVVGWTLHQGFTTGAVLGPLLGGLTALATVLGLRAVNRESARRGVLEERERLAREIHDTLAQGLASIQLMLGAASHRLGDGQDEQMGAESGLERDLTQVCGWPTHRCRSSTYSTWSETSWPFRPLPAPKGERSSAAPEAQRSWSARPASDAARRSGALKYPG